MALILEKIQQQLTKAQIKKIDDLLPDVDEDNEKQPYKRSILTGLRQVKQSLRPKDIKCNIHNFIKIKALHENVGLFLCLWDTGGAIRNKNPQQTTAKKPL